MADRLFPPPGKLTRRSLLAASCVAGLDAALPGTTFAQPAPVSPLQRPPQAPSPQPRKYPPRAYMFLDEVIAPALLYRIESNVSDALLNGVTSIVAVVSSNGGSIDAAVGIHNILASIGAQVTTYNLTSVGSAANIVFQAAGKRVAHPNAHFVFHPIANSSTINGINSASAHDIADSLTESTRQMREVLRTRTKMTAAQLDEMFSRQVIVGARQALDYGIVDEVAELKFPLGQVMIPTA